MVASQRYIIHAGGLIKLHGVRMFDYERDGLFDGAEARFPLPAADYKTLDDRLEDVLAELGANIPAVAAVATSLREVYVRQDHSCLRDRDSILSSLSDPSESSESS